MSVTRTGTARVRVQSDAKGETLTVRERRSSRGTDSWGWGYGRAVVVYADPATAGRAEQSSTRQDAEQSRAGGAGQSSAGQALLRKVL